MSIFLAHFVYQVRTRNACSYLLDVIDGASMALDVRKINLEPLKEMCLTLYRTTPSLLNVL